MIRSQSHLVAATTDGPVGMEIWEALCTSHIPTSRTPLCSGPARQLSERRLACLSTTGLL